MINHFKTWLLNREPKFFSDSLFPVDIDDGFVPSPQEHFSREIDRCLFGTDPDASLLDYRFFQFLRIIRSCHLEKHVLRFDSRETYFQEERDFQEESVFRSLLTPEKGLVLAENSSSSVNFLRWNFSVICNAAENIPITVFLNGDRTSPAKVIRDTNSSGYVPALGLTLTAQTAGSWMVDYRIQQKTPVTRIVQDVIDLPRSVFQQLFDFVKDDMPEYGEGFWTITDSLTKFCMLLFAHAAANEKLQTADHLRP